MHERMCVYACGKDTLFFGAFFLQGFIDYWCVMVSVKVSVLCCVPDARILTRIFFALSSVCYGQRGKDVTLLWKGKFLHISASTSVCASARRWLAGGGCTRPRRDYAVI